MGLILYVLNYVAHRVVILHTQYDTWMGTNFLICLIGNQFSKYMCVYLWFFQ